MYREVVVILGGFLVIIVPFLGMPQMWKEVLLPVVGGVLVVLGYWLLRIRLLKESESETGGRATDTFVEATKPLFDE